MTTAGVVRDLVRGRTPRAEDSVVQRAVDRLDRAAVGSFLAGTTAALMLLNVLVTLRSGHLDELGAAAGAGLLLLAFVHETLRRRALTTAGRCGLAPQRSWT